LAGDLVEVAFGVDRKTGGIGFARGFEGTADRRAGRVEAAGGVFFGKDEAIPLIWEKPVSFPPVPQLLTAAPSASNLETEPAAVSAT